MPSMWEVVKCVPCLVLYKPFTLSGSLPSLSAPSVEMSCSPLNRTSHPSSQHLPNIILYKTVNPLNTSVVSAEMSCSPLNRTSHQTYQHFINYYTYISSHFITHYYYHCNHYITHYYYHCNHYITHYYYNCNHYITQFISPNTIA